MPDSNVPNVKFGGGIMIWGVFFFYSQGFCPLLPVKRNLNASAYKYILDNDMLSNLTEQFGEGPFLFQHESKVHKDMVR